MANRPDEIQTFSNNDFVRILKRVQPTGLMRDVKFTRLLSLLSADPNDSELLEIVNERLQDTEMKQLLVPDPFRATNPLSQSDFTGEIILGCTPPNRVIWRIPCEQLTQHLLCVGRSGGGKTNTILLILTQLLENHAR